MPARTVFVFGAYGLWPMLEYELDIIQRLLDLEYIVHYFSCSGNRTYCSALRTDKYFTSLSRKNQCLLCKSRVANGLNWLHYNDNQFIKHTYELPAHVVTEINEFMESIRNAFFSSSFTQLIQLVNDYIPNLHLATMGPLISDFTNPTFNIFENKELYLGCLHACIMIHHSYRYFYRLYLPSEVYIYNGRGLYSPLLELSRDLNIPFKVFEYPETSHENYWLVENMSFFEVAKLSHCIKSYGERNPELMQQYLEPALTWLKNRQNFDLESTQGSLLNHKLSHMKNGQLPPHIPTDKPIISYFTSSENEYANNQDYIRSKLLSQPELILYIASCFPDITLVVRMHPNSSHADVDSILKPLSSQKYANLYVLLPSDPANSHVLIDHSTCVVTYGSSVGYEAAFKSKCVITIGYSFYHEFDFHACPTSLDELNSLIVSALSSQQTLFPNIPDRIHGAVNYVRSYMAFGTRPKYLRRSTYYGGYMIRNGKYFAIKPMLILRIVDALLSLIGRIYFIPASYWNR